jgi:hypothetical protein
MWLKTLNGTGRMLLSVGILMVSVFFVYTVAVSKQMRRDRVETGTGTVGTSDRVFKFEDIGVDLVVSKVVLERGNFSEGKKVLVKPYVKNMCNGRVTGLVKVLLRGLGKAVWIHGGIGSKEEKMAGGVLLCTDAGCTLGPFDVVVDNQNEIKERNESNNTCSGVQSRPSDPARKTHTCTIRGPHCPDAEPVDTHREVEPIRK